MYYEVLVVARENGQEWVGKVYPAPYKSHSAGGGGGGGGLPPFSISTAYLTQNPGPED
jgi:hypothetical protein